jgi:hypothetical protein
MWFWPQGRDACARVFHDLWAYARDGFEHVPTAIQRSTLYWSAVDWHEDVEHELDKDLDPYKRQRAEEDLATIDQLINTGFGRSSEFIFVDSRVNELLRGEDLGDLHAFPFEDLLELIPPDIRVRVQQTLSKREGATT